MIDQVTRILTIIKDEGKKLATGMGIDPNSVGYAVTQTTIARPGPDGQPGMFIDWVVTLTLRVPILGSEKPTLMFPVIVPSPIPKFMPPDAAFREAVKIALQKLDESEAEFMNKMQQGISESLPVVGDTMPLPRRG